MFRTDWRNGKRNAPTSPAPVPALARTSNRYNTLVGGGWGGPPPDYLPCTPSLGCTHTHTHTHTCVYMRVIFFRNVLREIGGMWKRVIIFFSMCMRNFVSNEYEFDTVTANLMQVSRVKNNDMKHTSFDAQSLCFYFHACFFFSYCMVGLPLLPAVAGGRILHSYYLVSFTLD